MANGYPHLEKLIDEHLSKTAERKERLQQMDLFVLDNSLRESTVGQLRGHTLENKWAILDEVKQCKFKNIIVSAFSHMPRVDDTFVGELSQKEEDLSCYYAFSEVGEGSKKEIFPVGLEKIEKYNLQNPIFEVDLAAEGCCPERICELLQERINYTHTKLCKTAKVFVNLRDFPFAMSAHLGRVFKVVEFLSKLGDQRPKGIIFEEPTGKFAPEQVGAWTKAIRRLMDDCGWTLTPDSGHLLVHIHKKWGLAENTQLECLASGANGIWASVCEEGAALGHACSAISIMNLVRIGNKKVQERYDCKYLRQAAINVTKITTGHPPHPKQVIYGERALDLAFGFGGIAGGEVGENEFDLAKFFGIEPPIRISTLASAEMVKDRLIDLFGHDDRFTDEIAEKMKAVMIEDLDNNRKEEYMSEVGLAVLFDRAGGQLTAKMSDAIARMELKLERHTELLAEVRQLWDDWDLRETESKDDCLEFYSFYNGFMAPFFGCYECEDSKKALQAIDMDKDNRVDWNEFCVYLKWALRQYPKIDSVTEVLTTAFTKGLIPAMQDEIVKKCEKKK